MTINLLNFLSCLGLDSAFLCWPSRGIKGAPSSPTIPSCLTCLDLGPGLVWSATAAAVQIVSSASKSVESGQNLDSASQPPHLTSHTSYPNRCCTLSIAAVTYFPSKEEGIKGGIVIIIPGVAFVAGHLYSIPF